MKEIKEQVVTYSTAILAKEKGFIDIVGVFRGKHYYNHKGELDGDCLDSLKKENRNIEEFKSISAPSQSLLQCWLREEHNIFITVLPYKENDEPIVLCYYYILVDLITKNNICFNVEDLNASENYQDYYSAMEEGLKKALKLIKK